MLRRVKRFVFYSIGHRGAFLMLLGVAFIFYGLGIRYQPSAYDPYPYIYLPWPDWAYIWIGAGIAALIGAFRKIDRVSFTVATMVSTLWSAKWFYVAFKLPTQGLWATGFTWAVITGIILIVATWPEVHIRFEKKSEPCPPEYPEDST